MDTAPGECGFRIESRWEGDHAATVAISGELDLATSSCLLERLEELQAGGIAEHLIIDLSSCTFLDSTGLSVMASAQKAAKAPLNVVATHPQIVSVLQVTAMDRVFAVHPDRPSAYEELDRQIQDSEGHQGSGSRP